MSMTILGLFEEETVKEHPSKKWKHKWLVCYSVFDINAMCLHKIGCIGVCSAPS